MIRASTFRLAALVASMAAVLSCDAGAPTGIGDFLGGDGTDTIGNGGGNPAVGGDGRLPTVVIDTPSVYGSLVNVGDSVLVAVRVRDLGTGIASLAIDGLDVSGNPEVGTQVITPRYMRSTSTFPAGIATRGDTVIRRIIFPIQPVDSTPDSLVIRAIVVDLSGLADTATQVVRLVAGPRVVITSPIAGDSVRPGTRVNIQFTASHPDGVAEVRLRAYGESTWPTPLDITFPTFTYTGNPREILDSASVLVPSDAPGRGRLTITAEAVDANRTPGAASPVVLRIRASEAAVPLVRQVVPPRLELGDSITIMANGGNGIQTIGFIVSDYDAGGTEIERESFTLAGDASNVTQRVPLTLPQSVQGRRISITSFATDRSGRTGYSVASTATTPVQVLADALRDTALVVYGRTFALPRNGIAGDIAVNAANGHVFVSNTSYNRLEVWQAGGSGGFDPNGVAVGAEPWGMTVSATNPNELLVANSGGTNISRVNITSSTVSGIQEAGRILTRNTIAYTVQETRDLATGRIRIVLTGPFSYSDRPQYIAQSAGGRIYYSTRPTTTAPAGTLRYLDPADAVPDSRQIWQYGAPVSEPNTFTVFNIDGASVIAQPADSPISDELVLCDHATGTASASVCAGSRSGATAALNALAAVVATDAVAQPVAIESLALTDTTFVAWSGNRNWVAFGEGALGTGRVILANDPAGTPWQNIFFSPGIDVVDLVDNAAEPVFGIALDQAGRALAVHGEKSYFGAVEQPFHLRMQGRFDSFNAGAGIAFHPQANVNPASPGTRDDPTRLAFVASSNGTIEIVDAYYFVSRGRLVIRNKLYGPLRASLPLNAAEVAAGVVVKLYGMTDRGLVVVDVTSADIKPVP